MIRMTEKEFTQEEFEGCPSFVPEARGNSYNLFDIFDTERLDYVGFIIPYSDVEKCERDCNIMNVVDYLLKELRK